MPKTILTAEDSYSVRQSVAMILRESGYNVIEAEDGLDAYKKAAIIKIDMLLTDINMPNMDGFELTRKIREMPEYRFIPILTLTTESQMKKKDEGRKAGATGWIVKPFTPERLIEIIRKVMRD